MSSEIPQPAESFFISESIADQVDMSQFSVDPVLDEPLGSAVIIADVILSTGESIKLSVSSCSATDNISFGIVTNTQSSRELSLLIGQDIESIALILADDIVFDVDVTDMVKNIEVQATGAQYYLVALNFEKKNLLING